jgi:hypothetical protein
LSNTGPIQSHRMNFSGAMAGPFNAIGRISFSQHRAHSRSSAAYHLTKTGPIQGSRQYLPGAFPGPFKVIVTISRPAHSRQSAAYWIGPKWVFAKTSVYFRMGFYIDIVVAVPNYVLPIVNVLPWTVPGVLLTVTTGSRDAADAPKTRPAMMMIR